ncbi:hypothetical protein ACROYT_G042981 [Oculina patagonica]
MEQVPFQVPKRICSFTVTMRAVVVQLLVASLSSLALTEGSRTICQRPPAWTINQLNPMAEARSKGHVVILGLMLAS